MCKISIFSWFGFSIPMEERFRLIKDTGFDGVLLYWGDEYAEVDGSKYIHPEMARQYGLFIENIHTPFDKTNRLWTDSINAPELIKRYEACINDCAAYEIPTAVIHLTNGNEPPPFSQVGLDRIKRLVDLAEKKNVNIALENLRRPDYLDYVFSNIESRRLGMCYDSGHENCYSKGTDLLSKYGSKLMALHLHDNDGTDDQHRIPGEGNIDWDSIRKKLKNSGYKGPISLEVTNEFSDRTEYKDPDVFLKRAYEAARKLAQFCCNN